MIISLCLRRTNRVSNDLTQMRETLSYNVCLDGMYKTFERCSILLVPSFGVSLPFR